MKLPHVEGEWLTEEAALNAGAEDHGRMIRRRPLSVLRPASVKDVIELVHFARAQRLLIAPRGQGHTTEGQSQVEGGVLLEMRSLSRIGPIRKEEVWVEAGASWLALLKETLRGNLTPPTLTDYIDLSVGGTLSVGGVGGQSFRYGAQTDNVLEIQVVTGRGELITCSREASPELFDACRAGLGQCGIIVGAKLRLVEAPPRVRIYNFIYPDLPSFLEEQRRLVDDGRFDYLLGSLLPQPNGGWRFSLELSLMRLPSSKISVL
jgi:cytokinin dehydrogenase